jgi:hypothetical protein
MRWPRIIFTIAGVVLVPLYFALDAINRRDPPPVTHVEFYYGFVGVALAWQLAFFVIASDPVRFRLMMLPAIAEKLIHVAGMFALYLAGRMSTRQFAVNLPDLLWGILFLIAFVKTRSRGAPAPSL